MNLLDKIKAFIVLLRPFVVPWFISNVLLGNSLAGFDAYAWGLASLIAILVSFVGHLVNAFRDYELGFDGINGSAAKPYTDACRVLPSGIISVGITKVSSLIFLLVSLFLLIFFAPLRLDVILLYLLGVFCALTYTDLAKKHMMGELYLFLGHGFATTSFAYSLVKPLDLTGLAAGLLLGFWAGVVYTVDQLRDVETDFARRVKNLAYMMFKANMRVSQLWYFLVTASFTLQFGFILLGLFPASSLLSLLILPVSHITAILLDCYFEKGVFAALACMWTYCVLMSVGILFM